MARRLDLEERTAAWYGMGCPEGYWVDQFLRFLPKGMEGKNTKFVSDWREWWESVLYERKAIRVAKMFGYEKMFEPW